MATVLRRKSCNGYYNSYCSVHSVYAMLMMHQAMKKTPYHARITQKGGVNIVSKLRHHILRVVTKF